MFGTWKGKSSVDPSAQSKVHIEEVSGYSSFLKSYRDQFNAVIGNLTQSTEHLSFSSREFIKATTQESKGESFCSNAQLQDVHKCFSVFQNYYHDVDSLESSILETHVPQLLFLNDSFHPPGIPPAIRHTLLLNLGKEMSTIEAAANVFSKALSLLFCIIDTLQQEMENSESEVSNHFMQNAKPLLKAFTLSFKNRNNYRGLSLTLLYILPYQPVIILLMRLLSLILTLRTVASFLPSAIDTLKNQLNSTHLHEETTVILQNWQVLSSYSLFSPLSSSLLPPSPLILTLKFLLLSSLLLDQQSQLYAKSFSSSVSLSGMTGLLQLCLSSPLSDQVPQLQLIRSSLSDHCHGESLYGGVNILQCESIVHTLRLSKPSLASTERRMKHKETYREKVCEMCIRLRSLTMPFTVMNVGGVVGVVTEAVSLYTRILMSVQAYLFIYRLAQSKTPLALSSLFSLIISLHELEQALFHNPSLSLLLPLLLSYQYAAISDELGASESTIDRRTTHLTDRATLLWLSFAGGRDIFSDKTITLTNSLLHLHNLHSIYQSHTHTHASSHLFFFNPFLLREFLGLPLNAQHIVLLIHILNHSLNHSLTLFHSLYEPRRSLLHRSLFITTYTSLFDFLISTLHREIDNSIRKHVFLQDYSTPEDSLTIAARQEQLLATTQTLLDLPPFSLCGEIINLSHHLTLYYNKNHYSSIAAFRSSFALYDLIPAYSLALFNLSLADPCLPPERHMPTDTTSLKALKHGDGLFGVNYDRLEQYVYVMSERAVLAVEGECVGCIPSDCEVVFVKDSQIMQKYIQERNNDELLDSIYRTASATELFLLELSSSLHEPTVSLICSEFYSPLFEAGQFLFSSIPAGIMTQLSFRINQLDLTFIHSLTSAISQTAVLIVLLQLFDQSSAEAREQKLFSEVIESFRQLCRRENISAEIVLIFAVVLFAQQQREECVWSPLHVDNVPYGVAVLLELFGLVGENE